MFSVVLIDQVGSMNIGGVFPGVVFGSVAFPLDEVLQPPSEHAAVQYLFHYVLLFTIYDLWRGRKFGPPARNRVGRGAGEFDNIEDWMQPSHGVR